MSGICGVVAKRGFARPESPNSDLEVLEAISRALRRRGPDDAGFLLAGGPEGHRRLETTAALNERFDLAYPAARDNRPTVVPPHRLAAPFSFDAALGVRRLAVSDPEGGHQPIGNEEGTVWVVLDGVIANASELRHELTGRGHRFATRAEAEVVVHLYEEHGWEGFCRLRGQFALALWDDRRRCLLLARDPTGLRPLFVAETRERFLFASEARALLRDRSLPRAADPDAARHFLLHGELPADRTLFGDIRALPPGHCLIRQEDRTRLEPLRQEEPLAAGSGSFASPAAALDPAEAWGLLRQTVASYLASDLPGPAGRCGVFLDGSLASAALALAARDVCGAELPTFALGAQGSAADPARLVAEALGTAHQEIHAEGETLECWARWLGQSDAPPSDPGALAVFRLCEAARRSITVALVAGDDAWPGGAFGLEGRAPLRDGVLRHAMGSDTGASLLLRRALDGRLPARLLLRSEIGPAGERAWRDLGGLAAVVESVLGAEATRARGLAEPAEVALWRAGWQRGDALAARRLWALLVLELWHRAHVDRATGDEEQLSPAHLGMTQSVTVPSARGAFAPSPLVFGTPALDGGEGRPLSILYLSEADPAEPYSGPARLAREWSVQLAARGHQVTVLTERQAQSPAADFELLDGAQIVRFPVSGGRPGARDRSRQRERERALRQLARERPIDVVLSDYPAVAALERAGAPKETVRLHLFHAAEPDPEECHEKRGWLWRGGARRSKSVAAERTALLACDGVMATSRFAAARLAARHGALDRPVILMPAGVDANRFCPREERWELRRRLGLPESAFLLFTLRPLAPGMGLENLITAMAGIHAAYPEAHLVIGGAGPLESALRRQVVNQRLGRAVTLAGRLAEETLPEYYAAADLFVVPSPRPDALGLSALEALASGTPVFATPVGALPEHVIHLDARSLFTDSGAGAIADAVIRHLPDLHHDETLRRRCRQHALEHFDWEVLIPQLERNLRASIARRPGAEVAPASPLATGLVPRWPCFE
jgi:asparagine synthase (glutamine-hydrolysing)